MVDFTFVRIALQRETVPHQDVQIGKRTLHGSQTGAVMQVIYDGNDGGLNQSAQFVSEFFGSEVLWRAIIDHGAFDRASISPEEIVARLKAGPPKLYVRDFTPGLLKKYYYRKTVAKVESTNPPRFAYHTKFRHNTIGQKVNTIVHEYVHIVDNADGVPGEQMGHGSNSSVGKDNTAPYWIGNEAQRLFELQSGALVAAPPEGEM